MAQFIEVGSQIVNADAIRRIERKPDGGLCLHLCEESVPVTVAATDAKAVLDLVLPPKPMNAGLKELPAKKS